MAITLKKTTFVAVRQPGLIVFACRTVQRHLFEQAEGADGNTRTDAVFSCSNGNQFHPLRRQDLIMFCDSMHFAIGAVGWRGRSRPPNGRGPRH
jgi:hypothetical protein